MAVVHERADRIVILSPDNMPGHTDDRLRATQRHWQGEQVPLRAGTRRRTFTQRQEDGQVSEHARYLYQGQPWSDAMGRPWEQLNGVAWQQRERRPGSPQGEQSLTPARE